MRSRTVRAWPIWAPVLGTALALLPRLNVVGLHEDEGVVSAWAALVAAGNVPYRDFFAFATPGAMLLYGAEYRLFGISVLADRLLTGLAILAAVGLLAAIARRFLAPEWAAAVALLWGVWLPVFLGYSQYHFWTITFALACALPLLRAMETDRASAWIAVGVSGCLSVLFLQSLATVALAALVLALLRGGRPAARVGALAAGALLPGGLLLGYLLLSGSFSDFLRDTAGFTLGTYRSFNQVPFPWNPLLLQDTLNWRAGEAAYWGFAMLWLLGILLPAAVAVHAAAGAATTIFRRQPPGPALQLGIVSSALFGSVLLGRIGGPLCWLAAPLALILLALRFERTTRGTRQLLVLSPVLCLLLLGLSPAPVGWALSCVANPGGHLVAVLTPAGRVCTGPPDAPAMREAVGLVAAHPGSRVAFLPTALELYELTRTAPVGPPLWLLHGLSAPDLVDRQEQALLAPDVEYVLYVEDRGLDIGHPWSFDEFLAANFTREDEGRAFVLYRRR